MCPSSASTTCRPFGRCGSSSWSRMRRGGEVERSADEERRNAGVAHAAVLVGVRRRRARREQPAAAADELRAGVAEDRVAAMRALCEVARRRPGIGPRGRCHARPRRTTPGTPAAPASDRNQNPLASPFAAESHEVDRHRCREGLRRGRRLHQPDRTTRSARCPLDRQAPEPVGHVRGRPRIEAARSSVRLLQPRPARRAGVAADQRVGHLRVPEEVPGRVDPDHHRPMDAARVAPGVDHRGARAGALADEVDAAVAERPAGGLEIVDPLGQRVAGEVDAVCLEPVAQARNASGRRGTTSAEEVGRVLQRRQRPRGSRAGRSRRRRGSRRGRRRGCRRAGSPSRTSCS